MSSRPGVLVTIRRPAPPGVSPNAFVGELTAEVRCFWTPDTPFEDIRTAINDAAGEAVAEALAKYSAYRPAKQWLVEPRDPDDDIWENEGGR